jgi:hypothetical protein
MRIAPVLVFLSRHFAPRISLAHDTSSRNPAIPDQVWFVLSDRTNRPTREQQRVRQSSHRPAPYRMPDPGDPHIQYGIGQE